LKELYRKKDLNRIKITIRMTSQKRFLIIKATFWYRSHFTLCSLY